MTFILKLTLALITGVPAISPFEWELRSKSRSPCSGVTKVCAAKGRSKKLRLYFVKKFLTSSSGESMTVYLK